MIDLPLSPITVPFFAALAISLALVPICRAIALRTGFVAQPKEDRWHRRPTALLGGVAIGLTMLFCLAAMDGVRQTAVLAACVSLMFLVGLADDLLALKPSTKLVAEIAIAAIFLSFGFRLNWTVSITLDSVLTVVWIVGITNAFNLLDNMDGLCAGVALIVGTIFLFGLVAAEPGSLGFFQARYVAVLLGALAGFLVYNLHPASVFMGDSGSLLIGLSFAGLTLGTIPGAGGKSHLLSIVAAPVMVLLIPIFDTTLVTVSRMLSGRSAAVGGRDHSSHRLVAIGLSEPAAVRVLWLLAAAGGAIGLSVQRIDSSWAGLATATFLLAMVIFAVYLSRVKVYEDADMSALHAGKYTPIAVEFVYRRRIAEVMLDLCVVSIAYYASYRLRFEEAVQFGANFPYFVQSLPVILGAQMISLFVVGAYRGVWRYFGLMDAVNLGKGVLLGTFSAHAVIWYLHRSQPYSRTVSIIYAALLMLLLTTSRASFRLIGEFLHRRRHSGQRLVIYGAGEGGLLVLRELVNDQSPFKLLGFIDDDPRKTRIHFHGYPVLGGYDALVSLVAAGAVDSVVVSARLIDLGRLRDLEQLCTEAGMALSRLNVELKQLVRISNLTGGSAGRQGSQSIAR